MEAVYVPQVRDRNTGSNLRELATSYLTNGRYDPRKSDVRAEEYKQSRNARLKKRMEVGKHNAMVFDGLITIMKAKIRY